MNAAVLSYSLTQPVSRFLGSPKELLIDGEWVPAASGKTFPVYDPATGRVSAEGKSCRRPPAPTRRQ